MDGRIGQLLAGYGKAFGMQVCVWGSEASRHKAEADGYRVEKRYFRLSLYYTFLHFLALLVQHWAGPWIGGW